MYEMLVAQQDDIRTFHLWLQLVDLNLTPNEHGTVLTYHNVESIHKGWELMLMSLDPILENPPRPPMGKTKFLVLAYSSEKRVDLDDAVPWGSLLEDLLKQHQIMWDAGEIQGDYDAIIACDRFARLYTLRGAEDPNLCHCWMRFTEQKQHDLGLQPLWVDRHDKGPLLEFQEHHSLLGFLLRAFAWDTTIPYVRIRPEGQDSSDDA
jgi:hypothetical protein